MSINILAVIVATILYMGVGFLWYGPFFSKPWMKLVGMTKKDMQKNSKSMPQLYAAMGVLSFLICYMLAAILSFLNIWIPMDGVYAGVWVGIVFVGMTSLSTYLFEGRPIKLFLINYGYHVVALGIVGGFLAMWR